MEDVLAHLGLGDLGKLLAGRSARGQIGFEL